MQRGSPLAMLSPMPFRFFPNPRAGERSAADALPEAGFIEARAAITAWPDYARTPLRDLPAIARQAGIGALRLKDESGRFGLGSFKVLGGAYAVDTLVGERGTHGVTVTCATDGNHGRAVAWGARRHGVRCVVFLHEAVSEGRARAIADLGAELRRVPGTYDDAVRQAAEAARAEGWIVVADTAWPGNVEVPRRIMQGYRLMADEALDQWPDSAPPTHVFVQAGVGGMAAAVSVHLRSRFDPAPSLVVVEPEHAACLLASAEQGGPTALPGSLHTIMAGLACGEPSLLAWPELDRNAAAFMAIPDEAVAPCMRMLAAQEIVAGESGVAGLAALLLACGDPAARSALALNGDSRVLLFGTEGATDPALYAQFTEDASEQRTKLLSRGSDPA